MVYLYQSKIFEHKLLKLSNSVLLIFCVQCDTCMMIFGKHKGLKWKIYFCTHHYKSQALFYNKFMTSIKQTENTAQRAETILNRNLLKELHNFNYSALTQSQTVKERNNVKDKENSELNKKTYKKEEDYKNNTTCNKNLHCKNEEFLSSNLNNLSSTNILFSLCQGQSNSIDEKFLNTLTQRKLTLNYNDYGLLTSNGTGKNGIVPQLSITEQNNGLQSSPFNTKEKKDKEVNKIECTSSFKEITDKIENTSTNNEKRSQRKNICKTNDGTESINNTPSKGISEELAVKESTNFRKSTLEKLDKYEKSLIKIHKKHDTKMINSMNNISSSISTSQNNNNSSSYKPLSKESFIKENCNDNKTNSKHNENEIDLEEYDEENSNCSLKWDKKDDQKLYTLVNKYGDKNWDFISKFFDSFKTPVRCFKRWNCLVKPRSVKGPWNVEEDKKLIDWIKNNGPSNWTGCADLIEGRTGKQCRERWANSLNPLLKKGLWESEEDYIIFKLFKMIGSKWATISNYLVGRTENSTKNRFYSTLRRYAGEIVKQQSSKNKMNFTNLMKFFPYAYKDKTKDIDLLITKLGLTENEALNLETLRHILRESANKFYMMYNNSNTEEDKEANTNNNHIEIEDNFDNFFNNIPFSKLPEKEKPQVVNQDSAIYNNKDAKNINYYHKYREVEKFNQINQLSSSTNKLDLLVNKTQQSKDLQLSEALKLLLLKKKRDNNINIVSEVKNSNPISKYMNSNNLESGSVITRDLIENDKIEFLKKNLTPSQSQKHKSNISTINYKGEKINSLNNFIKNNETELKNNSIDDLTKKIESFCNMTNLNKTLMHEAENINTNKTNSPSPSRDVQLDKKYHIKEKSKQYDSSEISKKNLNNESNIKSINIDALLDNNNLDKFHISEKIQDSHNSTQFSNNMRDNQFSIKQDLTIPENKKESNNKDNSEQCLDLSDSDHSNMDKNKFNAAKMSSLFSQLNDLEELLKLTKSEIKKIHV